MIPGVKAVWILFSLWRLQHALLWWSWQLYWFV